MVIPLPPSLRGDVAAATGGVDPRITLLTIPLHQKLFSYTKSVSSSVGRLLAFYSPLLLSAAVPLKEGAGISSIT